MIIDFNSIKNTNTDFYKEIFTINEKHHLNSETGEHYKLLTYISYLYNNILILDVGTYESHSSIALSQNKNNKVITYDILDCVDKDKKSKIQSNYKNLEFKIIDINDEDINIIKSPKIIFLDIIHDGIKEKKFSDMLYNIGYEGYLICDDIFSPYHPNMKPWWDSIDIEKYDLTEIGHLYGTGLINYYRDNNIKIIK